MREEVRLLGQYLQLACSVLMSRRLLMAPSSCINEPQNKAQQIEFDHVGNSVFHGFAFRFLATRVGFRPAGTRFLVRGAAGGVAFRARIRW